MSNHELLDQDDDTGAWLAAAADKLRERERRNDNT